jgi:putative peptide zinc metalloprotease protein
VFPFNRPTPPDEGDNQALAVNTQNGGVVYDVAFALVWAEGVVDNVNSAYALASCENCKTVAVAFQAVIVVGQSNAIAPQNLAAAINYNCIACVTQALAQQLVVTIDRPLGDGARAQVEALWKQMVAFGEALEGLSFAEIQARLSSYEQQLLTIIERDQGLGQTPRSTASASATPTQQSGGTETSSPSAGAEPTGSASALQDPSDTNTATASEGTETSSERTEPSGSASEPTGEASTPS